MKTTLNLLLCFIFPWAILNGQTPAKGMRWSLEHGSITTPVGYEQELDLSSPTILALNLVGENEGLTKVQLMIQSLPMEVDLEGLDQSIRRVLNAHTSQYETKGGAKGESENGPYLERTLQIPGGENRLQTLQFTQVIDHHMINLACITSPERYEEKEAMFREIWASLEIRGLKLDAEKLESELPLHQRLQRSVAHWAKYEGRDWELHFPEYYGVTPPGRGIEFSLVSPYYHPDGTIESFDVQRVKIEPESKLLDHVESTKQIFIERGKAKVLRNEPVNFAQGEAHLLTMEVEVSNYGLAYQRQMYYRIGNTMWLLDYRTSNAHKDQFQLTTEAIFHSFKVK